MAHSVRSAFGRVFWEFFSVCAVLSSALHSEGWCFGAPIDIMNDPHHDLLGPQFFRMVVGLILEGRIAALHMGPLRSSFSMAFNRFPAQQIRSSSFPTGLPNLSEIQQASGFGECAG